VRIKGPEVLGPDKIEKNSFERIVFLKKKHFIHNFLQKKQISIVTAMASQSFFFVNLCNCDVFGSQVEM
jgi:hypothetical protein